MRKHHVKSWELELRKAEANFRRLKAEQDGSPEASARYRVAKKRLTEMRAIVRSIPKRELNGEGHVTVNPEALGSFMSDPYTTKETN